MLREQETHTSRGRAPAAEGPLVVWADFQSELIKSRADHANLLNFILLSFCIGGAYPCACRYTKQKTC